MDYDEYRLTLQDNLKIFLVSTVLSTAVSQLFYDSWYGLIACIPVVVFLRNHVRKKKVKERKRELSGEFLESMQIVSNSLLSGSSMENAWCEAEKEMRLLHGENSLMCREMVRMNAAVRINENLEDQLSDFADRSKLEDVQNFSEVFSFAKRSGGDMVEIIENTVIRMRAKLEVEQEIDVLVSSKRLEQKILNVIPILILAYLKLTSADYLSVLYGNVFGVLFMTAALAAYGLSLYLSERILRIQV